MIRAFTLLLKECLSLYRLCWGLPHQARKVIFYAESARDYRYFEGFLLQILERSSLKPCYITSDASDPILSRKGERLKVFYLNRLFPFVIAFLDAELFVMTMPDLHQFHIRRSLRGAHHLYLFHAMMSTHMIYRFGAFDHYDTIFCVGPHQVNEIRQAESQYRLPPKQLLEVGYPHLDQLMEVHQRYRTTASAPSSRGQVLIAPSWGPSNLLESCVGELTQVLSLAGYQVVIRPHPEWVKRHPRRVDQLRRQLVSNGKVQMDLDHLSTRSIHEADLLITDWSGIALEYAFGTERPVLFIDVPPKVNNPRYTELQLVPLEVELRGRIGKVVPLEGVRSVDLHAQDLIQNREAYRQQILQQRARWVFHLGRSSSVGAEFILGWYGAL